MPRRFLDVLDRSGDGTGRLPRRAILLLAGYALACVVVLGGVATAVLQLRLDAQADREHGLLAALEARELARHDAEAATAALRRSLAALDDDLQAALAENGRLSQQLALVEAERRTLETERRLARERAQALERRARERERWLATEAAERLALANGQLSIDSRLGELRQTLERAVDEASALRQRLAAAEEELARHQAERQRTADWLTLWIGDRLAAIETVLQRTGLEPEQLLARSTDAAAAAQGGPLLPATAGPPDAAAGLAGWWSSRLAGDGPPDRDAAALALELAALAPPPSMGPPVADVLPGRAAAASLLVPLAADIGRLEAAERLLAAMPLGAPFDHFHLTSRFGPRIDPITRRRATHHGLDFGAAAGSTVLATAPGTVVRAGRAGSYGIMVELDHGHGITTRYAHLSRALVEVGQRVERRAAVGVIGTTGRSTGRHLHYEVRLDGEAHDPARFLAAGRQLVEALGS